MTSDVTAEHDIFDRSLLVQRRNRVAATASAHDFLLARVAQDLFERLGAVQRDDASHGGSSERPS